MPPLAEKCIASWRKYCPDYEIIRWDESNYDFAKHPYMKQAFEAKKWGFVPDYARLDIVWQYGGIYLDTDVEVIKSLDDLLSERFYAGFETDEFVNLGGGFGAEAGHHLLREIMDDYDNYSFVNPDGSLNLLPSPQIQSRFLRRHYDLQNDTGKIQHLNDSIAIYPEEYLCPLRFGTKHLLITDNTYSIHHYCSSWMSLPERLKLAVRKNFPQIYFFIKRFTIL